MLKRAIEDIVVGVIYAFFVEIVSYILIFVVTFFIFPAFNPGAKVYLGWITALVYGAYDVFVAQLVVYGVIALFSWELSGSPVLSGASKRSLSILGVATTIMVALAGYIVDTAPPQILELIRASIGVAIIAGLVGGVAGYIARSKLYKS